MFLEQFINITLTVDDFTFYLDKGKLDLYLSTLAGSQTDIQFLGNFIIRKKSFPVQVGLVMVDYRLNAVQHRIKRRNKFFDLWGIFIY